MTKLLVLLLFGIVTLHHLGDYVVLAGPRNHIEPVVSNVYYLQDYCNVPKTDLERKYRHRRSSSSEEDDHDHDHDHDHDSDKGHSFAEDLHQTVSYYAKKGIRKAQQQIQREWEIQRKWKQIFLDPITQPSVVIRLWRPNDEYHQEHHRILQQAARDQTIRCNILLRMSANTSDSVLTSLANSTMGAVVNFLKLDKKPWLNNYRLRIVTSDPNMTQYWLQGRRLATTTTTTTTTTITTSSSGSSTQAQTLSSESKQVPVAVDLLTDPTMNPPPLQNDEIEQIEDDQSKWLLVELETINEVNSTSSDASSNDKGQSSSKQSTSNSKPTGNDEHDDTELVINLYTQSTQTVRKANSSLDGQTGSNANNQVNNTNETVSITYECPMGTFDCAGDGSQCIPSGLRCNGEDNCGNRFDELFNCGTVNLYYIFGSDGHRSDDYLSSEGFWFAVRILVLLFLVCLMLYTMSLLCRRCCDRRRAPGILINGKSPMVYVHSAKGSGAYEPLLSSGSSASSTGSGYGPTAGRTSKVPNYPPPSYFGNQSDNQKSHVNEYIYVNNNYGQPQGSTTVNTSVRPSRDNLNGGGASAPPQYQNDCPPLYPNIDYPNYGGTNKQ